MKTSADYIAELCEITGDVETIDLTYGQGVFWRKFEPSYFFTSDLYESAEAELDFMRTMVSDAAWDLVVFDPPFTANGPSKQRHQERYHSHRDQIGAPQNIKDVHALLVGGIKESCRISNRWVIVKTQDVVESGKLHGSHVLALNTLVKCGFNIHTELLFHSNRRPQPTGRRVTGLGKRPSVFILAEKWKQDA